MSRSRSSSRSNKPQNRERKPLGKDDYMDKMTRDTITNGTRHKVEQLIKHDGTMLHIKLYEQHIQFDKRDDSKILKYKIQSSATGGDYAFEKYENKNKTDEKKFATKAELVKYLTGLKVDELKFAISYLSEKRDKRVLTGGSESDHDTEPSPNLREGAPRKTTTARGSATPKPKQTTKHKSTTPKRAPKQTPKKKGSKTTKSGSKTKPHKGW